MDERNNPWTSDTHICPYVSHLLSRTNPGFHSANCNPIYFFFCFVNLAGAKIETSLPLVPLQNAAPHGQSKQNLKPCPYISESVECFSVLKRTFTLKYIYRFCKYWLVGCFLTNIYIWKKISIFEWGKKWVYILLIVIGLALQLLTLVHWLALSLLA